MQFEVKTRAEARALLGVGMIAGAMTLALAGAYVGGDLAARAEAKSEHVDLTSAARAGFSDIALQSRMDAMAPGARAVAERHDPLLIASDAQRDRQSALLAGRLEQLSRKDAASARLLRANYGGPALGAEGLAPDRPAARAAAPFRMEGALESSRDLDCLTEAVYYEARGESPAGQAAVAQVVLNRVRHPAFPKTVCAVVHQRANGGCQFSFACDGSMRRAREAGAWNRSRRVAERALNGAVMAEVGSATHFHTLMVAPGWGPSMSRVAQIGLHVFYRYGGRNAVSRTYVAQATPRETPPTPPAKPVETPAGGVTLAKGAEHAAAGTDAPIATAPAAPAVAAPPPEVRTTATVATAPKPAVETVS